jgi:murein DD-endopeptidase MepM/ murein hydrolase activator NlpD
MTARVMAAAMAVAAILLVAPPASAQPRLRTPLSPPVSPACVSSSFGPRYLPNEPQAGAYHYGIDLPAPEGAAVSAIAPGTVIRIQHTGPGGLEMLVQHDGFVGVYSHFGMIVPAFAEGKRSVAAGEKLGIVGMTGVTSGPHLYFEMILDGRPVDPAPYLNVAMCNGALPRTAPVPITSDTSGGMLINGRRYWQFSLPVRQYIQWQQH